MVHLIIGIIAVILFWLLLGILASIVPFQYHFRIRIGLIAAGVICLVLSVLGSRLNFLLPIGLIMGGLLFMPLRKQLDLILDIFSSI